MSDGTTHDDQRLPWLPGSAEEERPPPLGSAKKVLAGLLVLFLMVGVGLISFLAGRASLREPVSSETKILPGERPAPAKPPEIMPQPAAKSATELDAPPPMARMLEVQSQRPVVVPKQPAVKQSAIRMLEKKQSPRLAEFRPSRRVRVARRKLAQAQRVLFASRVVQLGQYTNRRQAEAAYGRLVKAYPYLKTLPKTVPSWQAQPGSARAYYLRLSTYSPEHARILCQNLRSIGRGCAVLPERT